MLLEGIVAELRATGGCGARSAAWIVDCLGSMDTPAHFSYSRLSSTPQLSCQVFLCLADLGQMPAQPFLPLCSVGHALLPLFSLFSSNIITFLILERLQRML